MDFEEHPTTDSWEKVTRKMVDPITFTSHVNIAYIPRVEDCDYETTCYGLAHPRFGEGWNSGSTACTKTSSSDSAAWNEMDFSSGTLAKRFNPAKVAPSSGVPSLFASKPIVTPKSSNKRASTKKGPNGGGPGGGNKPSSLGAFFKKTSSKKIQELDNQSLSSKSMNSRSVADRSNAERSKSEEELAKKSKSRRSGNSVSGSVGASTVTTATSASGSSQTEKKRRDSKESAAMMSIDETSVTEFTGDAKQEAKADATKTSGILGTFLSRTTPAEENNAKDDDNRSIGSKSISALSNAERSKTEKKLRDKKSSGSSSNAGSGETKSLPVLLRQQSILKNPDKDDENSLTLDDAVEKKLRFTEGHTMKEIPRPTDSMYDDLFYGSEELADFRYEAFLEEAGLDVNEYM